MGKNFENLGKNREKLGKIGEKSPVTPRPLDKKPDLFFFGSLCFAFCVEQQGKRFVEAIKHI